MYSDAFCRVYNMFGWNYFPEAFGEQLLEWLRQNHVTVKTGMDLACGTGVLCEVLYRHGIEACGMDLSEGMIAIAREKNPQIQYEVADMIRYHPERTFDLVTCTGDALNHIIDLNEVDQVFKNVYGYLNEGGYFIFDILNEKEVVPGEPVTLDFSDEIKAEFTIARDQQGIITLKTAVFENGEKKFEEKIIETVHDTRIICELLRKNGFQVISCENYLLENAKNRGTTWFVIARK